MDGGRERTVHSLCWHNPSHFSHNAAWKTHSQSLLTTCKCYCHTINYRQQLSNKVITTCRALLQALLINTEAESKSTHLTLKTRVYLTTPLCVSTLQTRISVMLDAAFSCGHLKVTHRLVLWWLLQFSIWIGKDFKVYWRNINKHLFTLESYDHIM